MAVRSVWLQEALRDGDGDQPPLRGDAHADVCIVRGGFTGLWTAPWHGIDAHQVSKDGRT